MSLQERYKTETAKWDDIAGRHISDIQRLGANEDFHQYSLDKISLTGVSQFLGDLHDRQVLEIGCGEGLISVLLAKSGAHVTSFDLSPLSVQVARRRAGINCVKIDPLVSAGEYLPFGDDSFEIIFGKSILHHLSPEVAHCEIFRVLRHGGKAVFIEPMGMNPLLNFVRKHVAYPHKNMVGVDKPLTYHDMNIWTQHFQFRNYREIQLLSMIERGFGKGRRFLSLRKLDNMLLEHVPFLRPFCRYVVITAIK